MYRAGSDEPALLFLSDLRNVFDGNSSTRLDRYILPMLRHFRDLNIPYESVIDRYALFSVLSFSLGLMDFDPFDQLGEKILRQHLHFHKSADRVYELVPLVTAVVKILQLFVQ